MSKLAKLTWAGKNQPPSRPKVVLVEDRAVGKGENRLIHGDALGVLPLLDKESVRCICIDPPYNTGREFTHYADDLELDSWLSLMYESLRAAHALLTDDGSLWVFVAEDGGPYLRLLCDEVFGRENLVQTVVWQRRATPANDSRWFSDDHDYILVYARNKAAWRPNRLSRTEKQNAKFENPDNDPRGPWNRYVYTCNKSAKQRPRLFYAITQPNTNEQIWPKPHAVWRFSKESHEANVKNNLIYWGRDGLSRTPTFKSFLKNAKPVVPRSVWLMDEVGNTRTAMMEQKALFPQDPFATPKPEAVVRRILEIATNPGELVLDFFAGSGTTGAVAHKLDRRWIMVEFGDQCFTHIEPRLARVVDGTDRGGISEGCDWRGGGGFRILRAEPVTFSAGCSPA
jgi:adenine-specific DNA-methyltransferase